MSAAAYLARLDVNVDAFYCNAFPFAEFHRRNRAIWRDIEAAGMRADVEAALRMRP